jgi:cytochrome P450
MTAEVRDAFNSDQDINITSANKLDYLLAVLNESLRLYPPAPGSIPRIIVNSDMIAGQYVPPGVSRGLWSRGAAKHQCLAQTQTTAGVFQWIAYHSSSNFHDCESFVPERWLPEAPAEFSKDSKDSKDMVQPFSAGPRNCIGKKWVLPVSTHHDELEHR